MSVLGRTESIQMNSGLKNFLRNHVPSALSSFRNAALHPTMKYKVFIGNEAADADSIISSLVYSYFKYTQHITESTSFFIPVVSIVRSELHLRRDVKLLLNEVNIDLNDLVCIDDCNFMSGSAYSVGDGKSIGTTRTGDTRVDTGNIEITLLDHNSLTPIAKEALVPPGAAIPRIVEILDHHVDAGDHKESCSGSLRNIAFDAANSKALVGSACTLVYEQITRQAKEIRQSLTADIAVLLKGVIALDTLNMNAAAQKGTMRDEGALAYLSNRSKPPAYLTVDQLFDKLVNAKTDIVFWRELSAAECLRLDQKTFTAQGGVDRRQYKIVMSSILLNTVEFLQSKSDVEVSLGSYLYAPRASPKDTAATCSEEDMNKNNTNSSSEGDDDNYYHYDNDLVAVMSMVRDPTSGAVRRELLLAARTEQELQNVASYFVASSSVDLDLQLLESKRFVLPSPVEGRTMYTLAFQQGNLICSRKQVAPELVNYFSSLS